jgi:hypothetical protein
MKTADLITALAVDEPTRLTLRRAIMLALAGGLVAAGLVWWMMLGPRPDIAVAMHTPRFVFKFIVSLSLAATAAAVVFSMARPFDRPSQLRPLLLLAPLLLALAVIAELFTIPASEWMRLLIGHNARVCTLSIPTIAALPLALMLLALREGAPARPGRAGALAGLIAGGLGAFFYAAHCPDDSPLFVATWYTLGIGLVTAVGAMIGARMLRW